MTSTSLRLLSFNKHKFLAPTDSNILIFFFLLGTLNTRINKTISNHTVIFCQVFLHFLVTLLRCVHNYIGCCLHRCSLTITLLAVQSRMQSVNGESNNNNSSDNKDDHKHWNDNDHQLKDLNQIS